MATDVHPVSNEAPVAPPLGDEVRCLNCGAALVGEHCHKCGQSAHVHRTLSAWWHDFVHSVLHLDGKFWRTLPLLVWRPGELTRRYVEGERARFVSPLALFLFSVFLMFSVFSLAGVTAVGVGGVEAARTELPAEMEENRRALARLEAERRQAAQAEAETEALDRQIAEARENLAGQEEIVELIEGRGEEVEIITGWGWLDKAVRKAAANPSLLFYKMQANAYKFSWALIPISVPFVWLLFLNRRRYRRSFGAYDHVVFVTYSIAFMSLALIAFVALRSIGIQSGLLTAAFVLVPPLHIYRHLKGAYGLSRWSATWRTIAVLVFANTALTLFLLLLLTLGALG